MRTIIKDEKDFQVQRDEDGVLFHYEKSYVPTGDGRTEYCLTLRSVERAVRGEAYKTYVSVKNPASKHFIIIKWPGIK